jgi:hypothetical protein
MIDSSRRRFAVSINCKSYKRKNLREYAVSYKRKNYIKNTKNHADSENTSRNAYKHYHSEDQ